jgi:putative AlgH/UPF0301 family transcriptional regulator
MEKQQQGTSSSSSSEKETLLKTKSSCSASFGTVKRICREGQQQQLQYLGMVSSVGALFTALLCGQSWLLIHATSSLVFTAPASTRYAQHLKCTQRVPTHLPVPTAFWRLYCSTQHAARIMHSIRSM